MIMTTSTSKQNATNQTHQKRRQCRPALFCCLGLFSTNSVASSPFVVEEAIVTDRNRQKNPLKRKTSNKKPQNHEINKKANGGERQYFI